MLVRVWVLLCKKSEVPAAQVKHQIQELAIEGGWAT